MENRLSVEGIRPSFIEEGKRIADLINSGKNLDELMADAYADDGAILKVANEDFINPDTNNLVKKGEKYLVWT